MCLISYPLLIFSTFGTPVTLPSVRVSQTDILTSAKSIVSVGNGNCASTCALFTTIMFEHHNTKMATFGGHLDQPMEFKGMYSFCDIAGTVNAYVYFRRYGRKPGTRMVRFGQRNQNCWSQGCKWRHLF